MFRARAVVAALVVAGFLAVAAGFLSGAVALVETHGNSMAPRMATGDLVVVRQAAYSVGDVVAYHSADLQQVVLHRVISIDGDRYKFQGDNNDFVDPETPTREQLIGKELLHIPQGGVWLDRLTSPTVLGLVAFGLLAGGGTAVQRRRTRRRTTMSRHTRRTRPAPSLSALPQPVRAAAAAVAGAGLLGLTLAALAWSQPLEQVTTTKAQSGSAVVFSYTAEVPRSPAYDGTTVTSPQPVFRALASTVDVHLAYRGQPGSMTVDAQLSSPSGWQSTVPLAPTESFTADSYTRTVTLDLPSLEARAQAAAEANHIPAEEVTVAVVPKVMTDDGYVFAPELQLALTPLRLMLVGDGASLTVSDPATVESVTTEPGTLGLLGREMTVAAARTISLVLLLGALLGAAVIGLVARLSAPATEGAGIRRRYAPILVRVHPMPTPPGRPVVDVTDFATLAKLAERYGLLIMYWARSHMETFVVQDEGTTYRYRTGTATATGVEPEDILDRASS